MPATYEPIASTTLGSNSATVTFSDIAGTYTDLVLVFQGSCNTGLSNSGLRFNGDTGTNFSTTILGGDGSTAQSSRASSQTSIATDYLYAIEAGKQSTFVIHIQSYASTNVFKTALIASIDGGSVARHVGLWRSTSAITSVSLLTTTASRSFATGATFALYGIKAA